MPYIGNTIRAADDYRLIDDISSGFNGSTTSFALQVAGSAPVPFPKSPQQVLISVNGVIQEPDPTGASGFNLVGTNIVFSSAPTNGHAFFGIIYATADYLNAGGNFPAGSLGAPSITFIGDENTGLFRKSGGSVGFVSDATEIANFDSNGITISSGNLIIPDSIIHNGDPDTKIRFGSANHFSVETAGVERLEIQTSEVVFNDTGADCDFRVEGDSNANLIKVDAGNDRVGIGLASPSSTLHAYHASANNIAIFESGDTIVNIAFKDNSTGSSPPAIGAVADDLKLLTSDLNRITVKSTGNVGIGIESPGLPLHVKHATSNGILKVESGDSNCGITIADNSGEVSVRAIGDKLTFNTSSSETEQMRIDNVGRVMIGQTTSVVPFMITANAAGFGGENTIGVFGDATSFASGVGGGVTFSGKYNSAGSQVGYAAIRGRKANATDGNYDGVLTFAVRPNGANMTERARLNSDGDLLVNLTTALSTQNGSIQAAGPIIAKSFINSHTSNATVIEYVSNVSKIRAYGATSGSGQLAFNVGGGGDATDSEAMRIDSSKRVIIGSTATIGNSYSNNLTVSEASGDVGMQFEGNNSNSNYASLYFGDAGVRQRCFLEAQLGSNGNYTIGTVGSGPIRFTNSNGEIMRLDSSGQVGIGTTSPSSVLHVDKGLSGSPLVTFHQTNGASSADAGLEVETSSTGTYIQRWKNSGTEHARITGAGLMGIGTTSPSARLSVVDDSGITIEATTNSTDGKMTIIGKNGNGQVSAITRIQSSPESNSNAATSTKILNRDSSNNVNEHIRISSNGDIDIAAAIGQTINSKVAIQHSGINPRGLFVLSDHASFQSITLQSAGSRNTTNGSYRHFQCSINGVADKMRVEDSGNVTNTNNSYGSLSDERLKENIVDASSQWDDIKALRIRKFNFKSLTDPDQKTMLGVVAQEAELVCPGLVTSEVSMQEGVEQEYKSFKYSVLYMKAIKCLQEAQAKIETLETKVAALEAA